MTTNSTASPTSSPSSRAPICSVEEDSGHVLDVRVRVRRARACLTCTAPAMYHHWPCLLYSLVRYVYIAIFYSLSISTPDGGHIQDATTDSRKSGRNPAELFFRQNCFFAEEFNSRERLRSQLPLLLLCCFHDEIHFECFESYRANFCVVTGRICIRTFEPIPPMHRRSSRVVPNQCKENKKSILIERFFFIFKMISEL